MKIAIMAYGTRGDVLPLTGLCHHLQRDGHHVVLAAQRTYRDQILGAGVDFAALPGDVRQDTLDSTDGQAFVDGKNMRPSKAAFAVMREGMRGVGQAMAKASEGSDLVLLEGPVGALLGRHVATALDIPSVGVMFQPATPTAEFSPPALGITSYGRLGNRAVWRFGSLAERIYSPVVTELRRELSLPVKPSAAEKSMRARWPILYPFSEHLVLRPKDWPEHAHITGYLWPRTTFDTLPEQVESFLAAGPAPIAIGLGSTATAYGERLSRMISDAIAKSGVRAIVQRGWAGLDITGNNSVLTVGDLPHEIVFPRCAAVVHHCGAGTTAATLRAGVPSIPVPGIMDQPFWAQRLYHAGVSTLPLPRRSLTADRLAEALRSVECHAERAATLGRLVRADDGASKAASHLAKLAFPPIDRS